MVGKRIEFYEEYGRHPKKRKGVILDKIISSHNYVNESGYVATSEILVVTKYLTLVEEDYQEYESIKEVLPCKIIQILKTQKTD